MMWEIFCLRDSETADWIVQITEALSLYRSLMKEKMNILDGMLCINFHCLYLQGQRVFFLCGCDAFFLAHLSLKSNVFRLLNQIESRKIPKRFRWIKFNRTECEMHHQAWMYKVYAVGWVTLNRLRKSSIS